MSKDDFGLAADRVKAVSDEFMALLMTQDEVKPPVQDELLQQALAYFVDVAFQAQMIYIHLRLLHDNREQKPQVGAQAFIPSGGQ